MFSSVNWQELPHQFAIFTTLLRACHVSGSFLSHPKKSAIKKKMPGIISLKYFILPTDYFNH